MDEVLKNEVINTVWDMYLKVLKKYTGFLNLYRNITPTDLRAENQHINELINASLLIKKYFRRIKDYI